MRKEDLKFKRENWKFILLWTNIMSQVEWNIWKILEKEKSSSNWLAIMWFFVLILISIKFWIWIWELLIKYY